MTFFRNSKTACPPKPPTSRGWRQAMWRRGVVFCLRSRACPVLRRVGVGGWRRRVLFCHVAWPARGKIE
jgi:hypothetical protein